MLYCVLLSYIILSYIILSYVVLSDIIMSLFLLCFIKVILYFLLCYYICYYIISYYIQVYHIMQYMLYNVYTCLIIYIYRLYTHIVSKSCLQMIQVPVSGTTLRASIWYWADVFSLLAGIARSCMFEAAHSQRPKSWPNSHGDVTYSLGHGQAGNKMQRYPASLLKLTFWLQTISLNQYLFPPNSVATLRGSCGQG